jgi:hypothetical protein
MHEKQNSNQLADIREVSVDRSLPKTARVAEYINQIHDPYRFKCGDITIRTKYTDGGATLEDCLARLFT